MSKVFRKNSESGQGMTEYIIIVALVAIAAIAVVGVFGDVGSEPVLQHDLKQPITSNLLRSQSLPVLDVFHIRLRAAPPCGLVSYSFSTACYNRL